MIDTSVLIAIIAGLVGLITLAIQTWGAIQLARIKETQKAVLDKGEVQAAKLEEVHVAVNSERSSMLLKLDEMHQKISKLESAADARIASDKQAESFKAGVTEGKGK